MPDGRAVSWLPDSTSCCSVVRRPSASGTSASTLPGADSVLSTGKSPMLCGRRVSRLPPSQMPYKVAEFHGHAWNVRENATACVPGQPAPGATVTAFLG